VGKFDVGVGTVVGGSVVLGCFACLGLFLGFLGRKIMLNLAGFMCVWHVWGVWNGGV
jgi:hypothetical protein